MGCGADAADPFNKEKYLFVGFRFTELFYTPMVISGDPLDILNNFAIAEKLEQFRFFLKRMIGAYRY
jgi:hypothetical protein